MLSSIGSHNQPMWLASTSTATHLPSKIQLSGPLLGINCKTSAGSFKLLRARKSGGKSTHVVLTPSCFSSSSLGGDAEGDGTDKQSSLERILLSLSNAIKGRNHEAVVSEPIRKECRPLQQASEMLSMLMRTMGGGNVVFVIRPSLKDGTEICVEWQIEWKKTGDDPSSGKGCDFNVVHLYRGKLQIRNMDMTMGLLLSQLQPLRLKLISFLLPLVHRIASKFSMDSKERKMLLCGILVMLVMTISFVVFKDLPV